MRAEVPPGKMPAVQAPALQALEGARLGGLVFLHPFRGAQNFTVSVLIHRDCARMATFHTPRLLSKSPGSLGDFVVVFKFAFLDFE